MGVGLSYRLNRKKTKPSEQMFIGIFYVIYYLWFDFFERRMQQLLGFDIQSLFSNVSFCSYSYNSTIWFTLNIPIMRDI